VPNVGSKGRVGFGTPPFAASTAGVRTKERLVALGYDVVASTPEEFRTRITAEIEMWAKVIRAANIKPQ
jgi:tripartite-type tricarboxylate transporter receptor subunit TctC